MLLSTLEKIRRLHQSSSSRSTFLFKDLTSGDVVLVKEIPKVWAAFEKRIQRLKAERTALQRISGHPWFPKL
jgi:hypothetical protein